MSISKEIKQEKLLKKLLGRADFIKRNKASPKNILSIPGHRSFPPLSSPQ